VQHYKSVSAERFAVTKFLLKTLLFIFLFIIKNTPFFKFQICKIMSLIIYEKCIFVKGFWKIFSGYPAGTPD